MIEFIKRLIACFALMFHRGTYMVLLIDKGHRFSTEYATVRKPRRNERPWMPYVELAKWLHCKARDAEKEAHKSKIIYNVNSNSPE